MKATRLAVFLNILLRTTLPALGLEPEGEAASTRVRALNEMSSEQLRVFLRGFSGDWRGDTDERRGVPPPASALPMPAGARLHSLVSPERFRADAPPATQVMARRRSRRDFLPGAISLEELSVLLWHTQGVTGSIPDGLGSLRGLRAAPSAGARYPLETYVIAHRVEGLPIGLFRFDPVGYQLVDLRRDDGLPEALQRACFGADFVGRAAVSLIWTAVPQRTEWRYGYLAHRMIAFEAGHVAQNALLAAGSLGLGACPIAAYHQPTLDRLLGVDGEDEFAIYLVVVGRVAASDEAVSPGGAAP